MVLRPRREAPPIGTGAALLRAGLCLGLLWAAFLVLRTPPAEWAFAQVAFGIAWAAELLLGLIGHDLTRDGIVLRETVTGAAVAVTAACDGHGLIAALAAALPAILMPGLGARRAALFLVAAFAAIELFNLGRVAVLFAIGPGNVVAFERAHYIAFPLASALFLALIAAPLLRPPLRGRAAARLAAAGLGAAVLAAGWAFWGTAIAHAVLLPVAEAWSGVFAPLAIAGLGVEDGRAAVTTYLVTGRDPTRYLAVPLDAAAFGLPLPLAAGAALLLWHRPAAMLGCLAAAILLCGLALAVAATTALHDAAAASGLVDMLVPEAGLYVVPRLHAPASDTALALLKAAQNALVHFNLFVLPFLAPAILSAAGRRAWGAALARA